MGCTNSKAADDEATKLTKSDATEVVLPSLRRTAARSNQGT